VRRGAELEVTDRAILYEILDAGKVIHIGIAQSNSFPVVIPLAYVRDNNRILIHGSTGSRLFRALAAGEKLCGTVTLLDGIVLARSAFHSAMNYRSIMIFGTATEISESDKEHALERFTNNLISNRWQEVRPMTNKEKAATMVLAIDLTNISGKVRTGGPSGEDESDLTLPIWAGHIPIVESYLPPIAAPDLPDAAQLPSALIELE
jgi:nitroimidazol reductase NimA-like FMN-containing flavoprotein (pyridoxamine 5'-phosphate oxidase superfamily)